MEVELLMGKNSLARSKNSSTECSLSGYLFGKRTLFADMANKSAKLLYWNFYYFVMQHLENVKKYFLMKILRGYFLIKAV